MRLYDVDQSGQDGLADAGKSPTPDKPLNTFGERERPKKDFGGFKV
jgi:hypothetical protein